ncbi:C3a anaphylatoxin chemotactic receptor-like [Anomaloglossus baeobatrachus]|uniref:C3a anaphylatoxin chemotactic receptor-like n=1 Tax=Anomaloglossus baeobatrachus TaxID=238106 RepID=UPI003F5053E2
MYPTQKCNLNNSSLSDDIFPLTCEYMELSPPHRREDKVFDTLAILQISITLYSFVFALGIIGNGLVIWIAGFRMKNTINAVWFLHLAIADFLCCASKPLRINNWINLKTSETTFCIANIFLFNVNMSTSVLLLTAMSIDRWVSVMWPFWAKVHRSCKLVRITAAFIWVLSWLLTGLVYFVYNFIFRAFTEWCTYLYLYKMKYVPKIKQTIQLLRLVIMCVIPFLIIVTSYVTIFYKIRKSKRSQRSQRSSRIITAVILCFFICWFPYYIWPLTPWYGAFFTDFYKGNTIVLILATLNSCMNPIIYVIMGQDFQQGFFRSIPARLQRALGDNPGDLSTEQKDCEHSRKTEV